MTFKKIRPASVIIKTYWFVFLLARSTALNFAASAESDSAGPILTSSVVNSGFEQGPAEKSSLEGWEIKGSAERTRGGALGEWALILTGTLKSPNASATQRLVIPRPRPEMVTLSGLVKALKVEHAGKDKRGVARFVLTFFNQSLSPVIEPQKLLSWHGSFGWRPWSATVRVPPEASELEIKLGLDGALGRVFFDEVTLRWAFPEDEDRTNFIVDGGFEYAFSLTPWNLSKNSGFSFPGLKGHSALRMGGPEKGDSEVTQEWMMESGKLPDKLSCSLFVKLDGVQALKESGGVKGEVEFFDSAGYLLSTQTLFGPWDESRDWFQVVREVFIPAKTHHGRFHLIMDQAKGTVFFDEVQVNTLLPGGASAERPIESRTDTSGWRNFAPAPILKGGPLDASGLLDAPAGRHGFLQATGGQFIFQDGTPVRFFGVNIEGAQALPDHGQAGPLAHRLAQLGANLVRLHLIDAYWAQPNLFNPNYDDTQHLSPESLDRLDYFIAQLKEQGIYVYLDLLVRRRFTAEDDVPEAQYLEGGAKVVALYNRRLIELQKQFARDFLTHTNSYTQNRLVEEPAVALIDLVNESSIFKIQESFKDIPDIYIEEFEALWSKYLDERGIAGATREKKPTVDVSDPLVQDFFGGLQLAYFKEMTEYLRGLGVNIPIAGSNLNEGDRDLYTNAHLDFIDRHAYWDYPKGGYGDLVKFHNRLLPQFVESGNPVVKLSRQRVKDLPFMVSEWNVAWPNEYRFAGPPVMTAYALFQDWNGMLQFNYLGNSSPMMIEGNFDVSTKPEFFLQFPALARIFYRRDVAPAHERIPFLLAGEPDIPTSLALMHGIERIAQKGDRAPGKPEAGKSPWVSDTGELSWDSSHGLVTIDTPRTQAAVGRVGGGAVKLKSATFKVEIPFASLILTSLDDKDLDRSKHFLLLALARSENRGTLYNATRTLLRRSGTSPILMEPVKGSVWLPLGSRKGPKVFALDPGGERAGEVKIREKNRGIEIPVGEAEAYEILFEASP